MEQLFAAVVVFVSMLSGVMLHLYFGLKNHSHLFGFIELDKVKEN